MLENVRAVTQAFRGEKVNDSVVPEPLEGAGHLCTCCGRFVSEERLCVCVCVRTDRRIGGHSFWEDPPTPLPPAVRHSSAVPALGPLNFHPAEMMVFASVLLVTCGCGFSTRL